jgi:signal transduction histidine kinase
MAQDINLSYEMQPDRSAENSTPTGVTPEPRKQGIRTHILLVLAMALVTITVTSVSLVLLRHRLRTQVIDDLSGDLNHSVITFENLQAERLAALDRENALLAELPTLKALMTSGDDLTIQDGAVEFWQLSGNDLFALADPTGRIIAVYAKNGLPDASLRVALGGLLAAPDKQYLIDGRSLYACSLRPLHFGSEQDGTLLGYVVSGISIERTVRQISQPTGVEATFLSDGRIVASTLASTEQLDLSDPTLLSATPRVPAQVKLADTRYLAATENLSLSATSALQLVLLKSFEPAELWISRMDRMVLSTGLLALLSGTALMIALARLLTRPLEELSRGVRAFGMGDSRYRLPAHGTQEVRELSDAFAGMRDEIRQKNQALLESERLATIGRMASSVSHDLRHYLAAVYANSEFLASGKLSEEERAEIFGDIRAAVHGTTDMIESLLIFSRSGESFRRSSESIATLLDGAITLVRSHPDADGVSFTTNYTEPTTSIANVDGKQMERAFYNLLLNACQAAKLNSSGPQVTIFLEAQDAQVVIRVIDNGPGVPDGIRQSLFEPFVSEGKQKGTGLGLTLAHTIADEHGGELLLAASRAGETIFQITIPWESPKRTQTAGKNLQHSTEVETHENVWT